MKIAIATVKGGVGKTTTTLNLGGALAASGRRVLLVDMDQQANLSSVFVDDPYTLELTVANLLIDSDIPTREAIRSTPVEHVDILPSNLELSRLDIRLAGDSEAQYYLSEKLAEVVGDYAHIIIDCPPNLGLQTLSALVAADGVIIPVECQEWAARGSSYILDAMAKVRRRANPGLHLMGYLINRYDSRRNIEETYRDVLTERFPGQVFETVIRNSVRYPEAIAMRQPITSYKPSSDQAEHFRQLASEVLSRGQVAKRNV